jgi:hypothetical protein
MTQELTQPTLNVDWSNDQLFFTHEWWDETSMWDSDPSVRYCYGSECYERKLRARVPIAFKNCDELIDAFICWMIDNYPDIEGFWV